MKTEAYFHKHCKDNHCENGALIYECPICHEKLKNNALWDKQWDIYDGEEVYFNCDNCCKRLSVYSERHGCFVEPHVGILKTFEQFKTFYPSTNFL